MNTTELAALLDKAFSEAHIPSADPGLELSFAILRVLSKRHGPSFLEEVRAEIDGKADRMQDSPDAGHRANAGEIRSILDG